MTCAKFFFGGLFQNTPTILQVATHVQIAASNDQVVRWGGPLENEGEELFRLCQSLTRQIYAGTNTAGRTMADTVKV